MAAAAKATNLRHVIWSTLEDTRKWIPLSDDRMPTLMGNYKVPHFDAKGESNARFTEVGVPTTFLLTSFYWDNFIYFGMGPKKGPDGKLAITLPMADRPLPGIAAGDIGKCAFGIFRGGAAQIGKTVGIAGEHLTGTQMAAALTRALGQEVRYNAVIARGLSRVRIPWRRGSRKHVPVLRGLCGLLRRRPRPRRGAVTQPRAADFRCVARRQQGPDPAGVILYASLMCGVTVNIVPAMSTT